MIARMQMLVLSLSLAIIAPAAAGANDRPTVFLHGFMSSSGDWAGAADRLGRTVAIAPRLPDLSWWSEFEAQARELQASTLPVATLAIGHSNGGLVAREWSRLRGLDGIATIGTPHGGAPILQHLLFWSSFNDATRVAIDTVLRAFSMPSDWWWVPMAVQDYLRFANGFSVMAVADLVTVLGVQVAAPVSYQMLPGSSYLHALNSSSNLGREASAVPNRVGIASVARNYFWAGPARAARPAQADTIATVLYATGGGLLAYGNLVIASSSFTDVAAINQGMSLIALAFQIFSIDPIYCQLVSHPRMGICIPNDGVVPVDRQAYPGAPNLWIEGPAHIQERQQSDDVLYHALVNYLRVPARSSGAPAPPSVEAEPLPPLDSGPDEDDGDGGGDDSGSSDTREPITIESGELLSRQVLWPDDTLNSTSGRLHLIYQRDGNLVLYNEHWEPLWASDTVGYSAGFVAMQGDGNLVVYDAEGVPRWASDTSQYPGAWLAVQNDGNVVIYAGGTAVWSSDTFID